MHRIVVYPEAQDQIAALPDEALRGYAEVASVLETTPWNGHRTTGQTRTAPRAVGTSVRKRPAQVVYLIVEDIQEVHVLLVQWLG